MDLANMPLPPDLEAFVASKVTSGEYPSQIAVVHVALALLQRRDHERAERLGELRKMVQVGLDQLDRGQGEPFDAEEIKAEIKRL
ncbi:MAG TPA: type II toxin-antitoxin system ParD family antitoxin [Pirellulales bacterium]|nr:type II toxin-antitoxin system ParD family antitoxin [Pirellulales bacterium]